MLDIVITDLHLDNPSGAECYNLTAFEMVSWIEDFSYTYVAITGR